jgi:O-antigen/teichoic acid export membrane protein
VSASAPADQGRTLGGVVARLTGVNVAVTALGLLTGPIQAQVLGPSGRGEVAAVIMTLTVMTWALDFGLTVFVARARARGTSAALVYGTVVPISCACSLIGVALAFPIANMVGQGRETVETFVRIGLILSPMFVALLTLSGAMWGEERWGTVAATRIGAPLMSLMGLAVLALLDQLTVTSALITLLLASVISSTFVFPVLRGSGRWRYSAALGREALTFGAHNWLASLAIVANLRIDQFLMAGLVSSRQLGLYAVATTVATFSAVFVGAVTLGMFPRVARGDPDLARRSCRIVLSLVGAASIVAALLIPLLLPLLFGSSFRDAVPMALILLVAGVASAFVTVLGTSLAAAGHPKATVRPQVAGLIIAVPLLILLLPSTGGLGASVISVGSGLITAMLMLISGIHYLGGRARDFLWPTAADLALVRARLLAGARRSLEIAR